MHRPNRSDKYQHILLELPFSYLASANVNGMDKDIIQSWNSKDDALYYFQSEEYLNLKERLYQLVISKMKDILTEHQYKVVTLTMDGYTQSEVADKLNIGQTSIHKCLFGNVDHKNNKRYGGAYHKLNVLLSKDEEVKELLDKIRNYEEPFEF